MTSPTRNITLHAKTTADGRGLLELEKDLDKAAKSANKFGETMADAESDAKSLETQIEQTTIRVRELGDEYVKTGDKQVRAQLRAERSRLAELTRIQKDSDGGVDTNIGKVLRKQTTHGMLDGIGDAFAAIPSRLRGIGIAAIVGFAAAAAPTLGAMIAGAVTGAVGLGGIAGGIAAASNSPAVRQAAKNLGSNIASSFTQMGDQFVEPLLRAFAILEQGWYDLNLEAAFEKTAAYVDDIAVGISGFMKGVVNGFSNALDNAGPILTLMRTELPRLGDAIGYMLDRMSQGRGVIEGFAFLMRTLDAFIIGTGNTIGWLADRFHEFISLEAKIFGWLEDIPQGAKFFGEFNNRLENLLGLGNTAGQVMNYVGRETQITAGSAKAASDAIAALNQKLYDQVSAALALSDAHLAYQADLLRVNEAVKEHGSSLKESTEAGVTNRQMINQLIGDLRREYEQALIAAGGNEEKQERARVAYNKQVADLQRVLQNLGFEKREIEKIIAAYKNIPTHIYTKIIQDYETRGVPAGEHSGPRSAENRQHGGPVFPGVAYQINERGRETVTFPAAGTVHPANLTPMTGGGGSPVSVTVNGSRAMQILFDEFVREVGRRGGTVAVLGVR